MCGTVKIPQIRLADGLTDQTFGTYIAACSVKLNCPEPLESVVPTLCSPDKGRS